MTIDPDHLAHARRVADAVLYEGYLLYPYRQSAQKNRLRFQFGVLMPPAYLAVDPFERHASQTECLAECRDDDEVDIWVRFLQLQRRQVHAAGPDGAAEPEGAGRHQVRLQVGGTEYTTWDEAQEREETFRLRVGALLGKGVRLPLTAPPGSQEEVLPGPDGRPLGRITRSRERIAGVLRVRAERVGGPFRALRLRARVENHTDLPARPPSRAEALRYGMIAAHTLMGIPGGSFLSLTDPPQWAAGEAAACANEGTWPVLAGPPGCRNLMLSSPVILYDHPEIAPESAGNLFDATEIDEILTLRTLALTEEEKRQARAGDARAAALLDLLEDLPPELLERMHGAIRYAGPGPGQVASSHRPAGEGSRPAASVPAGDPAASVAGAGTGGFPGATATPGAAEGPAVPWWDPGADRSVSPETDHVMVGGVRIARGVKVRMRPGVRRADAQDLFLAGREALVEAIFQDVDGQVHVAVSPAGDPLAELQRGHGRHWYFAPDEIEPVGEHLPGIREGDTA